MAHDLLCAAVVDRPTQVGVDLPEELEQRPVFALEGGQRARLASSPHHRVTGW